MEKSNFFTPSRVGMVTLCTYRIADALQLHSPAVVLRLFLYVALAAWLAAFAGFLRHLAKKLR